MFFLYVKRFFFKKNTKNTKKYKKRKLLLLLLESHLFRLRRFLVFLDCQACHEHLNLKLNNLFFFVLRIIFSNNLNKILICFYAVVCFPFRQNVKIDLRKPFFFFLPPPPATTCVLIGSTTSVNNCRRAARISVPEIRGYIIIILLIINR